MAKQQDRRQHEYAIGPSLCVIGGDLEATCSAAHTKLQELAGADAERGITWHSDRRAHIYRIDDGSRRFVGIVRNDGRYVPNS